MKISSIKKNKYLQKMQYLFFLVYQKINFIFQKPIKQFNLYKHLFRNKYALEIGGPSHIFQKKYKIFPIYAELSKLDLCNFSKENFWTNPDFNNLIDLENKILQKEIILEATNLNIIPNENYDVLINSHVIEHIANPIKALYEWKRILKPDGILLLNVPHKNFTYDHKRPITDFNHILFDFYNQTGEDDRTHFQEVLDLHDLTVDTTVQNYNDHYVRTLDNYERRIVHHHVFDTELVIKMINYVGLKILFIKFIKPYHILVVAQKIDTY
jgi:SAM-dependent methyltransferase